MKKRINLTPPIEIYLMLKQLAEADDVPIAQKVLDLLTTAIDMEEAEDEYFSALGDARATDNRGFISHEKFWDEVHKLQD